MAVSIKTLIILSFLFILTSCRSSKPTTTFQAVNDSLTFSTDASLSLSHDSVIISENTEVLTDEIVEFVEGGGAIYVTSDGSLVINGVASLHSSGSRAYSDVKENVSSEILTHRKNSLSTTKNKESHSEIKVKDSVTRSSLKWSGILSAIIFLVLIVMLLRRIRRK